MSVESCAAQLAPAVPNAHSTAATKAVLFACLEAFILGLRQISALARLGGIEESCGASADVQNIQGRVAQLCTTIATDAARRPGMERPCA